MRLPGPVRAHAARPLAWLAAGIVLAAIVTASRVGDARADRRDAETARLVDGRVGDGPRRGADIPVVYRNPVTGQRIEVDVATRSAGGDLRPGDRVALEVDPDDPDGVTLAGDRLPWFDPLAGPPFVLLGLGVCLARWWSVHRTVRMARSGGGAFAMLGAVAPGRPRYRRAVLHLYPLDAPAGAPSACAVRVLTTGGCPVAGPAFPVEVKGVPRPLGRVVARVGCGDAVLWPAARASLHGTLPRPPTVVAPVPPPPVDRAELPAWVAGGPYPRRTRLADLARPLAGALAVAVALGAVVTGTTLANSAAARQEAEGRQQALAEVVDRHGSGVTRGPAVELELALGGRVRTVTAPVAHPRDYTIGRRYPVLVDAGADRPVLLARERYDATTPIVMAWIPTVVVAVEAARRLLAWRRSGRLARAGPWSRLDVWAGARGAVLFGDRRHGYLRAALGIHAVDDWLSRRAGADAPGAPAVRDARGVVVAGRPEPGGTVAVLDDEGGVYVVARRLEVPPGAAAPASGRLVEAVRRAVARFTGSPGPAAGGATPGAGVPP